MSRIIGIDLGTTYSVCAVVESGQPKVIPSSEGGNLVPSVVEPQKRLVGDTAKECQIPNYQNTIFSVKRLMGKKFADVSVLCDAKHLPFAIKEGREGMAVIEIKGKAFTPQEISAMILRKIKRDAESFFGEDVTEAVITVPAYFDDSQRQATKQAGEIAGFDVRRIINEPTAASLAYGLGKRKGEKIVVYDLGGGTFDVSVLETGEGVFEVIAVSGDTHLGGDDFDRRIVDLLAKEFKLRKDRRALQHLRVAAERAKVALTSSLETGISVPPLDISRKFTRAELEWLTSDLIGKTLTFVERALSDAELSPHDIDEVVLVGGMTRMPAVREGVRKYFGKDPHTGVNPDEAVAVGAAIQGAILAGEIKGATLIDVTPLSLGIETLGGLVSRLIKRNTSIPVSVSRIFSTAADDQTSVEIRIPQGERGLSADNSFLGLLKLDDIPPAPRAVPRIEVVFEIDSDGILHVSAKDLATDREREITVAGSTGLSGEEVERMIKEAEVCAEEDRKKREHVAAINQATDLIYGAERVLEEEGGKAPRCTRGPSSSPPLADQNKAPQDVGKEVEGRVKELRALLGVATAKHGQGGGTTTEELRQKVRELGSFLHDTFLRTGEGERG